MDTMQLRYFIAVAEQCSFTAAATHFGITQPTICRQISALEEELGVRLLSRTPHGVTLTTAGLECLEYAHQLLDLEDQAFSRAVSISEGRSGIVRVAVTPSSTGVLNTCLTAFASLYPDIQVDVDMLSTFYFAEKTRAPSYDFYFMTEATLNIHTHLNYLCSKHDRFHFLVHKKDADLVSGQDFSSLLQRPFLTINHLNEPIIFERALSICRARGFFPKLSGHHSHQHTVLIAVNAGLGITILPKSSLDNTRLENIVPLPIEGDDACFNSLIAWPENTGNLASERFLEVVRTIYPNEKVHQ